MKTVASPLHETAERAPVAASDDKASQILEGARRVFLSLGFDGASMNDIARAAGVSKGTIYFHFDSKESLFEALIREERKQQAEQMCSLDAGNPDVATVLYAWGRDLLGAMLAPSLLAQVRTVMAVAPKFPRLARTFYESGPKYGADLLSVYIARQAEAGKLDAPDARRAAVHFIQLCQGEEFKELMFCAVDEVPDERVAETVRTAVEVFMKAYAPRL